MSVRQTKGAALASLLMTLAAGVTLLAAEPSRPYLLAGPTALRYAKPPDDTRKFAWPSLFPEPPAAKSNIVEQASGSAASATETTATNATVTEPSSPTPANSVTSTESYPTPTAPPLNLDNGPSSASPMLLVTPQMLADFFKSTGGDQPAVNGFPERDLRFVPPIAMPPPSSEAIYRSQ